jgi:hypothetical protein
VFVLVVIQGAREHTLDGGSKTMADEKRNDKGGEGFKGLKKEDHDTLKKAADMYTRVTGDAVKGVENIPVLPESEGDPSAIEKLAAEDLTRSAETTAKMEEAAQALRREQAGLDENGHPKSGPPEPILAPIAAKQAETVENLSSRGKEPSKRERETLSSASASRTGDTKTGDARTSKVSVSG